MKTTDEDGTTVYFNIPDDAIVIISDTDIGIKIADKSYMRFGKASGFERHASSYFWLNDEEFALLQKEIEQQFASPKQHINLNDKGKFLGAYSLEAPPTPSTP